MVRDALSSAIPTSRAYAVRDTQAGDVLAASLKAAYRHDGSMPTDFERYLAELRKVHH